MAAVVSTMLLLLRLASAVTAACLRSVVAKVFSYHVAKVPPAGWFPVGVPLMTPVLVLRLRPSGRGGWTLKVAAVAPV